MGLRVLLADDDPKRAAEIEAALRGHAEEVVRVGSATPLAEAVASVRPDVVLVDMALPDRDGLENLRQLRAGEPRPIVLFVDADDPGFMEEAIAAGVSSYNVVGAALPDVKPIVLSAMALFRRHRSIELELERAHATLDERTLVDRAKAKLIRQLNINEPQAYQLLRRRAMDQGKRIVDVARELLAEPA
jgi:response regulator NasT